MHTPAIKFEYLKLKIIDQTLLPGKFKYIPLENIEDTYWAIKKLQVRGAPLIGIVAAYALVIHALSLEPGNSRYISSLDKAVKYLKSSRPTAINLFWALDRMKKVYKNEAISDITEINRLLLEESETIHAEDAISCRKIGLNGAAILPDPVNVLTHCNAGSLATGGWGTALGVIYAAREKGINIHVYVDETRPLGQGARLTMWELMQNKVPCTLITDNMAASLMGLGKIDIVIFGADRIARNGDVANKIGSYGLAVLAKEHNIPVYAAAPSSTFDLSLASGDKIPIEQRDAQEVLQFYQYDRTLSGIIKVYNPAFDVTPAKYFSGLITERGILGQPLKKSITELIT